MSLVRITQEIVGQQYELGSRDCFRIVYDYLSRFINLPREWHGLTLEDYFQVFQQDPEEAKELIRQFWMNIFRPFLAQNALLEIYYYYSTLNIRRFLLYMPETDIS